MIFIDAAGGYLQHPIRLHLLLPLHLLVYRWIDLCLTSMFIRHHRGLPVLVGRAPQGTRARRGLPPCQEKGQGGAIPAVSKIVVDSNGQDECLLTVR